MVAHRTLGADGIKAPSMVNRASRHNAPRHFPIRNAATPSCWISNVNGISNKGSGHRAAAYETLRLKLHRMTLNRDNRSSSARNDLRVCRLIVGLFITAGCLVTHGCTYRAWHAGLQERQRQECYKMASPNAMRDCLDKVNGMSYDQYQKARKDGAKNDK